MKWSEGRTSFLGLKSAAQRHREAAALQNRDGSTDSGAEKNTPEVV